MNSAFNENVLMSTKLEQKAIEKKEQVNIIFKSLFDKGLVSQLPAPVMDINCYDSRVDITVRVNAANMSKAQLVGFLENSDFNHVKVYHLHGGSSDAVMSPDYYGDKVAAILNRYIDSTEDKIFKGNVVAREKGTFVFSMIDGKRVAWQFLDYEYWRHENKTRKCSENYSCGNYFSYLLDI